MFCITSLLLWPAVNSDEPHLVVVEQPQSKFRFRYKSEMVGTHGQLKAERADRNKAIFPTVKVVNFTLVINYLLFWLQREIVYIYQAMFTVSSSLN